MAEASQKPSTSRLGAFLGNAFKAQKPKTSKKPGPEDVNAKAKANANLWRDLPPRPQKFSVSSADSGGPIDLGVVRTKSQTPSDSSYTPGYAYGVRPPVLQRSAESRYNLNSHTPPPVVVVQNPPDSRFNSNLPTPPPVLVSEPAQNSSYDSAYPRNRQIVVHTPPPDSRYTSAYPPIAVEDSSNPYSERTLVDSAGSISWKLSYPPNPYSGDNFESAYEPPGQYDLSSSTVPIYAPANAQDPLYELPSVIELPKTSSLMGASHFIESRGQEHHIRFCQDVIRLGERTRRSHGPVSGANTGWGSVHANDDLSKLITRAAEGVITILHSIASPEILAEAHFLKGKLEKSGICPMLISQNNREAFESFQTAARSGYHAAWFNLGSDYEENADARRAVHCYRTGSRHNDPGCQYRLAMTYLLGQLNLPRNEQEAMRFLNDAANNSTLDCPHPPYVYALLLLHEFEASGTRISVDNSSFTLPEGTTRGSLARVYLERAAYLQYPPAQYKLGHSYEFATRPFVFDPVNSVRYYTLASRNGEAEADMGLSKWYLCGSEHFPKNEKLAFRHASRAALKGLPTAEFAMGYYWEVGVGCEVDISAAKQWYTKAINHGNTDASERLGKLTQASTMQLSTQKTSLSTLYKEPTPAIEPPPRPWERKLTSDVVLKPAEKADSTATGIHQAEILKYTLSAIDSERKIQSHKGTTRRLVSLCEMYVQRDENATDEAQLEVLEWLKTLCNGLVKRAGWDTFNTLVNYEVIRKDLDSHFSTIPSLLRNMVTADFMEVDQTDLDDLQRRIQDMLYSEESRSKLLSLRGDAAQSILELLDTLRLRINLDDGKTRRNIDQVSIKLCGLAGQVPSSYVLSTGLSKVDDNACAAGGFADVYRGSHNGTSVALKVVRVVGKRNIKKAHKTFYKEALMWKWLTHPNIVPFLGVANPNMFPLCLVSIWMENGNLLEYIKRYPKARPFKLASDIASGLTYIHTLNLVHGDLKSPNILVDKWHKACLSDFGLARVAQDTQAKGITATVTNTQYGSTRWMAPELIQAHPSEPDFTISSPSDVYAFGMVLLEIFTGKVPFYEHKREAPILLEVISGRRPKRPMSTKLPGLDDDVWSLIEDCWKADPAQRLRMATVLPIIEEFMSKSPFNNPEDGYEFNPATEGLRAEGSESSNTDEDEDDSD